MGPIRRPRAWLGADGGLVFRGENAHEGGLFLHLLLGRGQATQRMRAQHPPQKGLCVCVCVCVCVFPHLHVFTKSASLPCPFQALCQLVAMDEEDVVTDEQLEERADPSYQLDVQVLAHTLR